MHHPRNIKELQAFLGKINFLRRFIPNLAELSRLLNNILKKDSKVKWTVEANQAFEGIKFALTQAPVLTNPQFDREFIIFSFASQHTIVVVLLQKDDQGNEKPIAFFSKALRDEPLKYQIMEKQAYALVKAIKDFRIYILYSHVIAYVPSPIVKNILTQENLEGRRGKWIANILEFDIEIKPTKLIKGPIATERPFRQWGLDFIGEINPSSSGQHRWILTPTDYFTKWIEAIPCRQANDSTIIQFLETNILARFGCPHKIITDNAAAFRSKKMVSFCHKFHITLGHSTAYYPQGNVLDESSNKSLVNMIKKVLEENKKNWHKKLVNALWADRLTTKRSIGVSPYELVYGLESKFPSSLGIPVMKLLQESQADPNDMQRRVNQIICLQQTRDHVYNRVQILQEKLKKAFDRRTKAEDFNMGNKVLKWDSRRENKGKHGKFDSLWRGPFIIQAVQGNNTYFLKNPDETDLGEGPVNGRMLKHYFDYLP
eukprot:PITA_16485